MFRPGDPIPMFACRAANTDAYHFDTVAGRYIVLSFLGSSVQAPAAELIRLVHGDLRSRFDDTFLAFYGVTIDPDDHAQGRVQQDLPGIRYLFDFDHAVSRLYGAVVGDGSGGRVQYTPLTLVLDRRLRVIASVPWVSIAAHNEELRAVLDRLPPLEDAAAPALVIPRIFEPELCRELIALHQTNGGRESPFMRELGGKTTPVLDYGFKRRTDFFFEEEPEFAALRGGLDRRIQQRLVPELQKAFQFSITRIERYLIACYDAEVGGFFRPHRDNTTRGTAHRKFACTINLNADDYEGGDLRFPEFGERTYRAPTGGAVVFSCSLLHEARPVTKGTRFAFLPFFYDDDGAALRKKNQAFVSEQVVDRREVGS